jgi:site-specific recombinase XerD
MTPLRQRFTEDLKLRNRSPRTIACYVRHVANFAKHFGQSPEGLGPEQVRLYQLHLLEQKASWSAFNQCICALRFLYGITLNRPDFLERLPYGKRPKRLPVVLDRQEVLELLRCVTPLQHRMVLTTMYATGLRVSEAAALQVGHLDSRSKLLLVACGKGQKQRWVPMSSTLLQQLRTWWCQHRNPRWLFPGTSPEQPMDSACLQRACQKAVQRARLTKAIRPHSLRHTFATELLEAGVNLLTIQQILGHTSVRTTILYTHVRRDHLQQVSQVLDLLPLDDLLSGAVPPIRRPPQPPPPSAK